MRDGHSVILPVRTQAANLTRPLPLLRRPDDFVLATGETHEIREYIELAFGHVGITLRWEGSGVDEIAYNTANDKPVVKIDEKVRPSCQRRSSAAPLACAADACSLRSQYFRPAEVDLLHGDPSKAELELGWKRTCTFPELVKEMVEADVKSVATPQEDQN